MIYTAQEVFDFVKEEDVKFIRLAFCETEEHLHPAERAAPRL